MTFNRPLFSSARGDWRTPNDVYRTLDAEFAFVRDVTSERDGFDAFRDHWPARVYANPPYGPGLMSWLSRCIEEIDDFGSCHVAVFLLPARTDTRWYHDVVLACAAEIRFIRGRLRFKGAANSAPFPSMIVIFRKLMIGKGQTL